MNQLVNLEYLKTINQKKIQVFDVEVAKMQKNIDEVKSTTKELQRVSTMENILSINASIEAARAGSAGVGFAVVANEFGEISKGSAKTYEKIQDLVKEIEISVKNLAKIDL